MENLKNLFLSPKGHRTVFGSNVICLSIAFASFIVLMIQIKYEWGYDRFHTDGDRIFRLEISQQEKACSPLFARPLIDEFIKSSPSIETGALIRGYIGDMNFEIKRGNDKFSFTESRREVSPQYFGIFNFEASEGTLSFTTPGNLAIPESIAKKLFKGESAINQPIFAGDDVLTVAAVYKDFPENSVVKNMIYSILPENKDLGAWRNLNYEAYIKLTDAKAGDDVLAHFKQVFQDENYDWERGNLYFVNVKDIYFETNTSFDSQKEKGSKAVLYTLIGIAFLILIVAAINFMNFCIAIIPIRIKSINVQKVLGRSDQSLQVALLKEVLAVTLLAYLLSLLWVYMASNSFIVELIRPNMSLSANGLFILELFFIPLVIAFLAGLYPSVYATSFSPAIVLKGSFGISPAGRTLRNGTVGVQFMLSFILFIASSFIYLQNKYMRNAPMGFDKEQIAVVNMDRKLNDKLSVLKNTWLESTSIQNVGFAQVDFCGTDFYSGWSALHKDREIPFQMLSVDKDFPVVMGIPATAGRTFSKEDELSGTRTYLFNEMAAKRYNIETGDHLNRDGSDGIITGIIPDIKFRSFRNETEPMAFLLAPHNENSYFKCAYIRVKDGIRMNDAIADIQAGIGKIEPMAQADVYPFSQVLDKVYKPETSLSFIIALFSLISILISFFGVIGIVVFDSQYKRKEVSLRKVNGATTASIIGLFNLSYFRIAVLTFILATPISIYGMIHWLQNFAYKVPLHWWVFAMVFLIISTLTAAIVTLLTWKVANLNPVDNLKAE